MNSDLFPYPTHPLPNGRDGTLESPRPESPRPFAWNDTPTSEKKLLFIAAMKERGTVRRAAAAAGIHRDTAYSWRQNDPEFAAAWDAAVEDSTDVLEESIYERALKSDGMPGVVATIATLKSRRPEKWSEKHIVVASPGMQALTSAMNSVAELIQRANPRTTVIEGTITPNEGKNPELPQTTGTNE